MVLRQHPSWSDLILVRGQSILEKGQKELKGQMTILGPASASWDQISEIWPQKGQPGNHDLSPKTSQLTDCREYRVPIVTSACK